MDMDDDDEDRPVRRRSRRAVADTHEDTPDERLFDAVESLPSGHETVRRGKPMTSLLFQEPVLPAAVDVILETGQASVSMLQRRLKLGYARAARIVDEMEERAL